MSKAEVIWSKDDGARRVSFHKRAVAAARHALSEFSGVERGPAAPPATPVRKAPRDVLNIKVKAEEAEGAFMPNWRRIVLEVCEKHGLRLNDVISERRAVPLVKARQEAMYRLHQETTMSLPAIGRRLGNRDHTTVLYGIRRHQQRMQEDAA